MRVGDGGKAVVGALGWVALVAAALSFFNQWLLFGILTWLIMALALAVGFGAESARKPILYTIMGIFLAYSLLLLAMAWLDAPQGDLRLLLGFPAGTAVLVYGIWPVGVAAGILYGLVFNRSVLPEEKLQAFLREFGRGKPNN